MKTAITLILLLLSAGCSGNDDAAKKRDHVWKEQTDDIKKAEQVEGKIMKSAQIQKEAIEEQTR